MSKVKPLNEIIIGFICLLFLASGAFCFAVDTQLKLQMSPFLAPSNLTATVISSERIDLNWSAVSGAVSYKVYRNGVLIASPTTTSYSDTGLSSGTTYSYTVSAVNIDGTESPQSSSVSATTLSAPGGGMPAEWFMPPKVPEGGFRVLINNGAKYTDNLIATLKLFGGPDTTRMAISNFSDFRDAGQEPYTQTKTWNLCQGLTSCPEGKYTVYVKFFTPWGTASEVVSDSIIYRIKPIIERIKQKLIEIAERITILKNQIVRLFYPPEEIVPEEIPPEEIPLPIEEPLIEEIIPPSEEVPPPEEIVPPPEEVLKVGPIEVLKEFGRWLWEQITNFWQKIWPF